MIALLRWLTEARFGDNIPTGVEGKPPEETFSERDRQRLQADSRPSPDVTVPEPAGGNARPEASVTMRKSETAGWNRA